jgi:hypothetical protein
MGERRGEYSVSVGRVEEKSLLGRSRCRLEYNVKIDLPEVDLGGTVWIDLGQDRGRWMIV